MSGFFSTVNDHDDCLLDILKTAAHWPRSAMRFRGCVFCCHIKHASNIKQRHNIIRMFTFAGSSFFRHRQTQVSAAAVALSVVHYYLSWANSSDDIGRRPHYYSQSDAASSDGSSSTSDSTDVYEKEVLFENQCLKRQLYQPKVPYPAWDYNWDGNELPETSLEGNQKGLHKEVPGKTRHIILVRHGQYDETFSEDNKRILTPLGRLQAIQTGKRLRELMEGSQAFPKEQFRGPCPVVSIRVSDMARAKETAQLIASEMGVSVSPPDPDLNEALPAPMIPIRPDIRGATEEIDAHQGRIERAFQRYFYRDMRAPSSSIEKDEAETKSDDDDEEEKHEFEIIVCHGNVIRYFFCRALQLPPEAWLRMSTFNCSLTYLMIRPTGHVACRTLGDIGHLKYDEISFSGYNGFKW